MNEKDLIEIKNHIEFLFTKDRDIPKDETISKLFHSLDKKVEVILTNQQNQSIKIEEVHEQVCKTNGRVTKIEEWKATLNGKIAIITCVVSFIVYKFF
jgi:hypothetical protein